MITYSEGRRGNLKLPVWLSDNLGQGGYMKVRLELDVWYDGEENTKEGVEDFVRAALSMVEEACGCCTMEVISCNCED